MVRNRKQNARKIGNTDKERMKDAVKLVLDDGRSIRQACQTFGMKFSTLRRYVEIARKSEDRNAMSYSPNYACRQVFTEEEETLLQEYLIKASKIQYGLTRMQVRKLAYEFALRNNKTFPPSWAKNNCAGEDWFSGYMKRFPNLSLRRPEATSLSRATSFNRKNVKDFFDHLEKLLEKYHFGPNDIYNSDETGCTTVQSVGNTKVIACKNVKQVGKMTSGERGTLVTMLATINAAGNSVPPFMVFPRVHFKEAMLHGAPPGTVGAAHQSGWMTSENFLSFMHHFIVSTKCSKERPVLLILDNHESHLSIETIDVAKNNGVIMLTLPPHCSHKMQPLDRSVYGPFKTYYNQECNIFMVNHPSQAITIHNIAEIVGHAYPLAFTPKNITNGFKVSGIYPYNPNIFTEDDFLSSYVTDRPNEAPVDGIAPGAVASTSDDQEEPSQGNVADTIISTAGEAEKATHSGTSSEPVTPRPQNQEKPTHDDTPLNLPDTNIIMPEEISPFPKAQPRKATKGRKKGKTLILTDTPVKEQLRADQENKKRKKGKQQERKKKVAKNDKRKVKSRPDDVDESSSSSDEQEVRNICDSESDISDVTEVALEEVIEDPSPDSLKVDDFILVKFTTKKTKVMYVGQIRKCLDETDEEEFAFEVNFMRRERPTSYTFTFPNVEDVCDVPSVDIVLKLPSPTQHGGTARVARHMCFPVDLTLYSKWLR